jgi:riboflavin synthase
MFTGIITTTGIISRIEMVGDNQLTTDWRLWITSKVFDFSDVQIGDSIAVSGVCLTAVAFEPKSFAADVSIETLNCTTLRNLTEGSLVNLEKALQVNDRFGGHIVSGHVDGVGELLERFPEGRSERLTFRAPSSLARYVAAKGSICIDGVSLTVNEVSEETFGVNIIPHTADHTTLHEFMPGRAVNLEVDVVARYLERLRHYEQHRQ